MKKRNDMPIYMDYQATTPTDSRVVEAMVPFMDEFFGNAASVTHSYGWDAENAVSRARKQVSDLINANEKDIVFTSGATESNNLALKGAMEFYSSKGNHLITVATEHKCVIESANYLKSQGKDVTFLEVDKHGRINLEELKQAITNKTVMVSVMAANNETGILQDIEAIGKICKENKVLFHTDAAQAFGKIEIDVEKMNIDLMSISAHKIYGPKGVGALYVRRKPRVRLIPIIHGGGQERGLRSGTLATPLIVGFGKAADIAKQEMREESKKLQDLKSYMYDELIKALEEVYLNGSLKHSLPNCLNLSFGYVEGESLVMAIRDLAVSTGSACTSESLEGSYVLKAMGNTEEMAHSSIRFGLGRYTSKEDIDKAISVIIKNVNKLREMSPLWDMFKQGVDIGSIKWDSH
ncbi:MAG: IscS subfamily cysteine desulfurase [Proteobacteria bacterium]|nr:IscS subfamily cysteine desulfurase [Pseudomonadota bacterium]